MREHVTSHFTGAGEDVSWCQCLRPPLFCSEILALTFYFVLPRFARVLGLLLQTPWVAVNEWKIGVQLSSGRHGQGA